MTNAEKFKEVFGFDIDYSHGICTVEICGKCPYYGQDECMGEANKFWDNEYKGE